MQKVIFLLSYTYIQVPNTIFVVMAHNYNPLLKIIGVLFKIAVQVFCAPLVEYFILLIRKSWNP